MITHEYAQGRCSRARAGSGPPPGLESMVHDSRNPLLLQQPEHEGHEGSCRSMKELHYLGVRGSECRAPRTTPLFRSRTHFMNSGSFINQLPFR